MNTRWLAAVTLAGCLAAPCSAHAFTTRTSVDGDVVSWKTARVDVVADASLGAIDPSIVGVAEAAFSTWQGVAGANPPLVVPHEGEADPVGYIQGQANESTVRYAPNGFDLAGDALGITVVSFADDGAILDADVVINGGVHPFAILDPLAPDPSFYDLQNVLTHEAGHFFGLQHEMELTNATMYPTSALGEVKKRSLSQDDEDGLVSLYSASQPETLGGCSSSPWTPAPIGWIAIAGVALAACLSRARRSRVAVASVFAVAFAALTSPARSEAAPARSMSARAWVTVSDAQTHRTGGLLFTTLRLVADTGEATTIDVAGGHESGLTQIVGGHEAPRVGERIAARITAGDIVPLELAISRAR